MTLDPATLLKCHEAIPALGKVHAMLEYMLSDKPGIDQPPAVDIKEAADALWHWPELVATAVELSELKKRGQYHTLQVGKP